MEALALMPSYDDFERAIASGDVAIVESYFAQDNVREEVATAEMWYQRQSPSMNFARARFCAPGTVYSHRYPKARACGGECLIERTYGSVHIDVLRWFFSPAQIPAMGSMLAYLFNCFVVPTFHNDDLEALELLLTSPVFEEVLRGQGLQHEVLEDLLQRAWGVCSGDTVALLHAYGAQCEPVFARDFMNGPLGLVKTVEDFGMLFSLGIPTIGGHEFVISAHLARDTSSTLGEQMSRLKLFSQWDPSVVTGDILRMAARNEELEIVKFCLEDGFVDVDARSSNEQTALMVASHRIVMFWKDADPIRSRMRWEGWAGREPYVPSRVQYEWMSPTRRSILKTLLDFSGDPNVQDKYGHTALHHAVKHGCPVAVEMLVEAGADIHARTKREETVLDQIDLAIIGQKDDVPELFLRLVALGADPFAIGKQNQSAVDRLVETEDGVAFVSARPEQFLLKGGWVVDHESSGFGLAEL